MHLLDMDASGSAAADTIEKEVVTNENSLDSHTTEPDKAEANKELKSKAAEDRDKNSDMKEAVASPATVKSMTPPFSSTSTNGSVGQEGNTMSPTDDNVKDANGDAKSRNLNLISCEDCGLVCAGQSHYQVHIRSHTGERPFKCTVCGVAFTQKGNLRRHYKIHSEEKPFQCPVCSYRCRRRDALNGHMRIHSDIRPYRCVYCARSYKSRQSLKEHEYQCTYKNDPITQAASPSKSSLLDQHSSKLSPQTTIPPSSGHQQSILPSSKQSSLQPLISLANSPLALSSNALSSSSGKRKASNPQKFIRFREVSMLDSRDKLSPSHISSSVVASVTNALQFMPSVISSMMQQHMDEEANCDTTMSPQSEAIDFSSKRTSPKTLSEGKNADKFANHKLNNDQDNVLSYASTGPRIGGEFFMTPSSLLNGDLKREDSLNAFRKMEDRAHVDKHDDDHVTGRSAFKRSEPSLSSQIMEKLTGSARRKRPRFMNERVANENAAVLKQSVPYNYAPSDQSRPNSFFRHDDVTGSDHHNFSQLGQYAGGKLPDLVDQRESPMKSGDASKVGLRIFTTFGGENGDETEELPAYVCVHCRCIFLDHVMFSIHAGCHGYRDPLECSVCGHQAADRFQFLAHLTRGEHVMAVSTERGRSYKEGEKCVGGSYLKHNLENYSGSFNQSKLHCKSSRQPMSEVSLH